VRVAVATEMGEYIDRLLNDRLANPRDDMLTMIANAEIDGEPVDWDLKVGYINLLIIAGIDTTWSAIGSGCGTSPSTPTRSSASSPPTTTTCCGTPPPRRSCGTTRRSRWRRKVVGETEVGGCPVHPATRCC
jgi:hypothetical protein